MYNGPTFTAPPASVRLDRQRLQKAREDRRWSQFVAALHVRTITADLPANDPLAEAGRLFSPFTISRAERELPVAVTTAQLLALAYGEQDHTVFYAADVAA